MLYRVYMLYKVRILYKVYMLYNLQVYMFDLYCRRNV